MHAATKNKVCFVSLRLACGVRSTAASVVMALGVDARMLRHHKYRFSVYENSAIVNPFAGTPVVIGTVLATDQDNLVNTTVTYRIVGTSPLFHINNVSGAITQIVGLDRETVGRCDCVHCPSRYRFLSAERCPLLITHSLFARGCDT